MASVINRRLFRAVRPAIGAGWVEFTPSPDAGVTNYRANLRVSGNATIVDYQDLGVPPQYAPRKIVANLTPLYDGQTAGDYTVSIATTTGEGTVDSEESNAFTLPIA